MEKYQSPSLNLLGVLSVVDRKWIFLENEYTGAAEVLEVTISLFDYSLSIDAPLCYNSLSSLSITLLLKYDTYSSSIYSLSLLCSITSTHPV